MTFNDLKKDFPVFDNIPELCYLDSAATSQKPAAVISRINQFYERENANIHRGIYQLSQKASELYDESRKNIAEFVGADSSELIFVKNATEGINLIAYTFGESLKKNDTIIITQLEHHANIIPWQMLAKRKNLNLEVIGIDKEGKLNLKKLDKKISNKPALLCVTHVSNAIGTINPIKEIINKAHQAKVKVLVDGSQSVPHLKIDIHDLDADFFVFTGHKMLGPTGIGVLYMKNDYISELPPFLTGGDMIESVSFDETKFLSINQKFEAGTPNIAGAIGLSEAVNYLKKVGMNAIREHEKHLFETAWDALSKINGLKLFGSINPEFHSGLISFTMKEAHPHDIAEIFDTENIAVRAGHHCAQPLINSLGEAATVRISFYLYNDEGDVEKVLRAIDKVKELFK